MSIKQIRFELAQHVVSFYFSAAGIPDFRSPGTGLYDNLQKFNLPNPQAIFEIEFFKVSYVPVGGAHLSFG